VASWIETGWTSSSGQREENYVEEEWDWVKHEIGRSDLTSNREKRDKVDGSMEGMCNSNRRSKPVTKQDKETN